MLPINSLTSATSLESSPYCYSLSLIETYNVCKALGKLFISL